ncbi:TspO/MBR family protein [uncultured Umboniibacter sp.]|uniref:TspO/MBR family protein n=1 Tax=uncultured Umboniibacter sp. TaxID=1798917 RepID=UPI002605ADC0|nr:TspO/MBR family protein [uncultured Umboniibacter sp.]
MSKYSVSIQVSGLIGWLLLCYAASAVGAMGSAQAVDFYGQLIQPYWAPPPSLFGPVWALLYTMMAVSVWMIWRQADWRLKRLAIKLFCAQLVVNSLWSWVFFAWQLGDVAFINIVVLWLFIAVTLVVFWRSSKLAAVLLVPYLLWVSFAGALNLSLWLANPQLLG